MSIVGEFKDFISRGNVVDLAVAVVVGAAFTSVIDSFSTDIIGGVLGALGGEPDLSNAFILNIGEGTIAFGSFLTAIINFLIVAAAVFLVVKAINRAQSLRRPEEQIAEAVETEVDLLREIRDSLRTKS